MSLSPGTRIGPYEVVGTLGEGGMGQVYRARDPRLRRDVAIKILPSLMSSDPDRLARFEREGQALAALNHQHIAQIYGIEELDGSRCLVMELVEGPTLAELIASADRTPEAESGSARPKDTKARQTRGGGALRGLSIEDTVRIARQIASALDAAHEKGIIHRDLKPANIKLTPDGDVKVLDFGLAKALGPEGSSSPAGVSNSPTLTARATQLGVILGTGAYMAPEQAKGRAVDKRVDVWGFGCVLYELLTGSRAFEGDEITEVIARVIEREPDWSKLPPSTPPSLRRLIERCLAKDPKARLRDIGEARFALDDVDATAAVSQPVSPAQPAVVRKAPGAGVRFLPWAVAAVAVAAAAYVGLQRPAETPPGELLRVELSMPPDVELFGLPHVSGDGRTVVFIGVREGIRQVYVRRLDRSDERPVPGTEGASLVAVGADGRSGAVIGTDSRLKRVSFETDVVEPVLPGADVLAGLCVTADGTVVFLQGTNLMALPAGATQARVITSIDSKAEETWFGFPFGSFTPDKVLFAVRYGKPGQTRSRVAVAPLAGGAHTIVTENADQVIGVLRDRLVLAREGAVLVSAYDEARMQLTGSTMRVPEEVMFGATGGVSASVSRNGTIVFAGPRMASSRLVWVDSTGAELVLPGTPRVYQNPRLSPDGRSIAFAANGSMWVMDPVRGGTTRVSPAEGDPTIGFPAWSTDSARLFMRSRDGIIEHRADGEGQRRVLKDTVSSDYPSSVTPDGKYLIFLRITAQTAGDILSIPIAGGEIKPILVTPAYEGAPWVSPDGKWLTYVSNHSGPMEVYLRSLEGGERRWAVSSGGGLHPMWSRDGKQIYYRIGQKLMAVDVTLTPDVRLGTPRMLLERQYEFGINLTFPNYTLSKDGRQFLMVRRDVGSNHLNYVTNWLK